LLRADLIFGKDSARRYTEYLLFATLSRHVRVIDRAPYLRCRWRRRQSCRWRSGSCRGLASIARAPHSAAAFLPRVQNDSDLRQLDELSRSVRIAGEVRSGELGPPPRRERRARRLRQELVLEAPTLSVSGGKGSRRPARARGGSKHVARRHPMAATPPGGTARPSRPNVASTVAKGSTPAKCPAGRLLSTGEPLPARASRASLADGSAPVHLHPRRLNDCCETSQ
jgi:hypothetical protein